MGISSQPPGRHKRENNCLIACFLPINRSIDPFIHSVTRGTRKGQERAGEGNARNTSALLLLLQLILQLPRIPKHFSNSRTKRNEKNLRFLPKWKSWYNIVVPYGMRFYYFCNEANSYEHTCRNVGIQVRQFKSMNTPTSTNLILKDSSTYLLNITIQL